jgi:hypothetical protein
MPVGLFQLVQRCSHVQLRGGDNGFGFGTDERAFAGADGTPVVGAQF